MGGRGAGSTTRNEFREGSLKDIRDAVKKDLTDKESRFWGDDSQLRQMFVDEDMRVVDKALDYFQEQGITNLIEPSSDYPDEIRWRFQGTDRSTGRYASFEFDALPKENNAKDAVRGNGYSISNNLILPTNFFNYLTSHTNMDDIEIKAIRSLAKVAMQNYNRRTS